MDKTIILFNFKNYWLNPFCNKFLEGKDFEGIFVLGKKNTFLCHPFNYKQAKKEIKTKNLIIKELSEKE
jgi:hypothetical protein